ncbi:methyl farnesoate epoxidase-like [Hetaerina americana]|uniref:methyl farnesoate epoxidase-like n=1 Tax=Hetaerina americana TaxID=62018 RepID=UPI003A7F42A9
MDPGVTILAVAALLILIWMYSQKPLNFPPGPAKWPLIGTIFICLPHPPIYAVVTYLSRKYGEVVGAYIFNTPVIVISGLEGIREACFRDDLSGRPENIFQKMKNEKSLGEEWRLQRRFTLQHLRDLGFGKSSLDGIVHEELQAMFDDIDELSGGYEKSFNKPVDFCDVLSGTNINVLWHILAGKRYDHRESKFKELIRDVKELIQVNFQMSSLFHPAPWLPKIFPRQTGFSAYNSYVEPIFKFLQDEIDDHKKTIDYDHPRDFMDIYLTEIEKQKNNLPDIFNESQLKQVYYELFVAGTDTTLNTMSFAILYMILYPEAQKKVQQELDEVIGKDRLPILEDRARYEIISS